MLTEKPEGMYAIEIDGPAKTVVTKFHDTEDAQAFRDVLVELVLKSTQGGNPQIVKPRKIYVIWSENGSQNVNIFEEHEEGREHARFCIEFVEARQGAKLEAIVRGLEIGKETI